MGEFEGKIAVITGGSRGIGKNTAELMAREGASLALCARNEGPLSDVANQISTRYGVKVVSQPADIYDSNSIEKFIMQVKSAFGKIDILINNAGQSSQRLADGVSWPVNAVDSVNGNLPPGRFEKITDEEWLKAFQQKFLGMVRVTRTALPLLRKASGASIVNITSIKGKQPPPRVVTSGVIWAAVMNYSKGLSFELAADKIRVNVVSVGGILTPQMEAGRQRWAPEKSLEQFLAPRVANIPLGKLGTALDVAQAIVFLASTRSEYITGQCVSVDGGGLRSI